MRLEALMKRRKPPKLRPKNRPLTGSSSDSSESSSAASGTGFRVNPLQTSGAGHRISSGEQALSDEAAQMDAMYSDMYEKRRDMKNWAGQGQATLQPGLHKKISGLSEISIGRIAPLEKWRPDMQTDSKMVQSIKRKSLGYTKNIMKDDVWRRQQTRLLIEKMQQKLGKAMGGPAGAERTTRALTPDAIRELLTNPEFEEIAKEFKELYGG